MHRSACRQVLCYANIRMSKFRQSRRSQRIQIGKQIDEYDPEDAPSNVSLRSSS